MSRGHVAFVDDEEAVCAAVADWLESSGFTVETWTRPEVARDEIDPERVEAVITDLRMPDLPGDALLAALRARDADLPVMLMSAHADIPQAVAAMREGAYDVIEKPCAAEHLVSVLDRAVAWRRTRRELARLRGSQTDRRRVEQRLIGTSPQVVQLRETVLQLADTPVDLLLTGAPGTGREHLARLVHDLSRRGRRPFVAVDCAALPPPVLEVELFGHNRGAVPGTTIARHGAFEFAHGGTVYLSGIDALTPALQTRLFRVVQDRAAARIGEAAPRPVDIRLIMATGADLAERVAAGAFRHDLYFRLAAAAIRLPTLGERPEDVPLLYTHFAMEAARRFRREEPELSRAELDALTARDWPGNLPELQAMAERQVLGLRAEGSRAPPPAAAEDRRPLPERVAAFEAQAIAEALERCEGSSAAAAEELGLPRRTLNEKIARYGLRGG